MKTAVVIPNWNGASLLSSCLEAVLAQTYESTIVVVDNGSSDESLSILHSYGDKIVVIRNATNLGFSAAVNAGIRWALDAGVDGIALLNNDAVPEPRWLNELVSAMERYQAGIVTSLILLGDRSTIDTTGDLMTTWGLAAPRFRGQQAVTVDYGRVEFVFGACAAASLYRSDLFRDIGLFDEDFFAYYEDVDFSFRAQLAGWKVLFTPRARVLHSLGASSSRIPGFASYHTYQNMPLVLHKNLPRKLALRIYPRFYAAYVLYLGRELFTRNASAALRGALRSLALTPKKLRDRREILGRQRVTDDYIRSLLTSDIPEGYVVLRRIRSSYFKLRRLGQW